MKQQFSIGIIAAVPLITAWYLAYGSFPGKTAENTLEGPNSDRQMAAEFTNELGMKFVLIPAGIFIMGSPLSEPGRDSDEGQHEVTLTRPFYMQTTEVTQAQWQTVMGENPAHFRDCGETCPVEMVSWHDTQRFIARLNAMAGARRYRLPTEGEWEYAARSGSQTALSNGILTVTGCAYDAKLDRIGWYCGNSGNKPHPVAQKQPNSWGLYDMHGNVWEWCQDWYGDYPSEPVTDPQGPASGLIRVSRGGSWWWFARFCRSANRIRYMPFDHTEDIGFRLAMTPKPG
jgi:formylglycine-generating enzyme required for sulfatase activity